MQSAVASLRGAGPTRAVKCDDGSVYYGIGSEDLALSGHYDFQVVDGAVAFCGITLTAGPTFYHVSAPVAPYPYFKPAHARQSTDKSPVEALAGYPTIILIKQASHPPNLTAIAPPFQSLWHPVVRISDLESANLFEIPNSWNNIDNTAERIVVLGPKNSGKSSLCRLLCNRTASKGRVFYLELDPGQPEHTPPGCLTLHEFSDHDLNFSPQYAHPGFRNALKSHHLGYPSPMETPHRYMAMCEDLFDTYLRLVQPGDVLVVNTPGWTKGLGLELNSSIARMAQPAVLIHMGPSDFLLDDLEVNEVTKIEHATDGATTMTAGGFSSAELRTLQIVSYFHEHNPEPLTTWTPFEIPLGVNKAGILAFAVLDSGGMNLIEDLAVCVEGTLVSINIVHTDDNLRPVVLPEEQADNVWQISSCVGVAVVQSVSAANGCVRLLTPVDPVALDLGNKRVVLCRGRIQLPLWEIQNRAFETPLPWLSTTRPVGVGSTYTKFRRNLAR